MNKIGYITVLIALVFISCNKKLPQKVVAEAYGNKLFDTDLVDIISPEVSMEDSVFITKEYIRIWLSKQVLLHKSNELLTVKELDKSTQLESYKIDLLSYEVLNKLAQQKLDTFFSEEELLEYYQDHLTEFELSQNILKITFYKIPTTSNNISLLWSSFKSGDKSIAGTLITLSEDGGNYFVNNESWVYFDDILKEIPINTYNQEHYLSNNKNIQLIDGSFTYFIKIVDFKIRSTTSPFSIERDNIKEILLMNRQQKLVESIETNLIDEAYSNKHIKTF